MKRLLTLLMIVLLVTLGTTALVDLMPGSPAATILGEYATPAQVEALNAELGYDRPIYERYTEWLGQAVTGDLGTSIKSQQPVGSMIFERLPVSLELAVLALVLALAIAIPLGAISAAKGGAFDRVVTGAASFLLAAPAFVLAIFLSYVFAVQLGLLPPTGWVPFSKDPLGNLLHIILPVMTLVLAEVAILTRVLRADMVATLGENFVLVARARGMSKPWVVFRHALRPSMFSLLTLVGVSFGRLIGGAIIVESIFALPGLGSLAVQAISTKDIPVIQGIVVFVAVAFVVVNLAVDATYALLDPRTRKDHARV